MISVRLKAIVWLHVLRLWRYRYSFINMALNSTLWVTIFLLGALMFVPPEDLPSGMPLVFWGITMWTILSNSVWLVGAWTGFYISMGLVEEHMLVGISSSRVLVGRAIPGLSVSAAVILLIYYVLSSIVGVSRGIAEYPHLLVLGLSLLTVMALSYGLILSAISFRTGVPPVLLDIANFVVFIVGGIATPVSSLPPTLQKVAVLIPYSYPAEIVRYAAIGYKPFFALEVEVAVSVIVSAFMAALSLYLMRRSEEYIRRNGLKAIGRM